MPEKKPKLSPSEIKRRKRAEQYFDLFPEKKPQKLTGGELMMDIKKINRMCDSCNPVDLVLCIGEKWMCWNCNHNTMNLTKQEDDWI